MGKTFSTGLLTDGISQDSSNNIGIGGATSGTNKFEVSGSTKLNGNTAITGSLSITGSATTIGNTTISGSLTVSSSANAIILPAGQTIGLGTAQIYTGTGGNSGNIFVQGAQTKLYADKVILEAATAAGVEVIGGTKLSGSFIVSGSATTIGNTALSGSLSVSGSITSTSTITAQTLVVQTITSSVLYSSGSNIFGNSLSNTQLMTGSVGITGSLAVNGTGTFSGLVSLGSATATNPLNIRTANGESYIRFLNADGSSYGDFERSITGAGAVRFTGANFRFTAGVEVVGALTGSSATFSGAINSSASSVFNGTGRGISYQYCDMTNTSGRLILGLEGSTAGNAFPNSEAYSVNIGTDQNQAFGVFTNNLRRLTITSTGKTTIASTNVDILYLNSTSQTYITIQNNGTAVSYLGSAGQLINAGAANDVALTSNNNNIIFGTSGGTERMRITSDGNVLVGTTTTDVNTVGVQLRPTGLGIFVRSGASCLQLNRTTSDGIIASFRTSDVERGSISIAGATTSYNTSSDYRLKEDLKDFNALELLSNIKLYDFAWKLNQSRMYGVLAHELKQIVPYVVFGEKDEINEDETIKPQAVDYSKLVPVLVKAIQELKAENDALQNILQRNNII